MQCLARRRFCCCASHFLLRKIFCQIKVGSAGRDWAARLEGQRMEIWQICWQSSLPWICLAPLELRLAARFQCIQLQEEIWGPQRSDAKVGLMQRWDWCSGRGATCQRNPLRVWLISLNMAKVVNLPNLVPAIKKDNLKTANVHTYCQWLWMSGGDVTGNDAWEKHTWKCKVMKKFSTQELD